MTLRLTSFYRHALFRLGNGSCHRRFSNKEEKHPPIAATSNLNKQFNARKKNLVLNYINLLYKGQDRRLKSLQSSMDKVYSVRNKCGPLKSLDDLVDVVGLSVKESVNLCDEIAHVSLKKRRNIQFSYPTFTSEDSECVDNVLAIHTSLYCVAWAHLEKSGRVKSWHKETLPLGEKQKHPIDCIQAVMNFHDKIPAADAYVLETPDVRRAKDSSEALDGFLLTNINCSILATVACLHSKNRAIPRIYYMNRSLVPLLFDLSVGVEIVSRFRIVEKLINESTTDHKDFNDIVLDDWLRDLFMESNDKMKEELSIPLLAAMAAMEILVRRNTYAIEKVMTS